ncbi:unnamed protein product [Caenorhabditis angaria]|uniref:CUB-like domain-containing protein n=1 Tax=Caenorhabditis angaria TaxID=860376 RepID=A0A9P1ISC9_9PELO|nr:unnamed protein product [Caenorhabditis angaria]
MWLLLLFVFFPISSSDSNFLRTKFTSNKRCITHVEVYTNKREFMLTAVVPVFPGTPTYFAIPYHKTLSYKFKLNDMISGRFMGSTLPSRLKSENQNIQLHFKDSADSVGGFRRQSDFGITVNIETNVDCPQNFSGSHCENYAANETLTNN